MQVILTLPNKQNIKTTELMKTHPICLLLLTIALSVEGSIAERPNVATRQMPSANAAVRRPASMPNIQRAPITAPLQLSVIPSARTINPSVVRPALPAAVPMRPLARPNVAVTPSVRSTVPVRPSSIAKIPPTAAGRFPATNVAPAASGGRINLGTGTGNGRQIAPATPTPRGNIAGNGPLPEGLHGSLNDLREGMAVADQLKQMQDLRLAGVTDSLRDSFGGSWGNAPGRPGKPNIDLNPDTPFSPREPQNPLNQNSKPGGGFRCGTTGSARYQESDSTVSRSRGRDMSSTGLDLVRGGARDGDHVNFGRRSNADGSYDLIGVRTSGLNNGDNRPASTSVSEHHDSNGVITGYTETRRSDGTNGSYTDETVHRDASGDAQDVVVVEHNGQTNTDTKTVYNPDGSVRSTTLGCGRDPDGSSIGGPVNGTSGSLQDQLGLKPVDLLRQPAEDENSGGTNRMTGQLGGRQVRPGNPDETPMPGANRNRLPGNHFGNIVNPGPAWSESTSGNPKD